MAARRAVAQARVYLDDARRLASLVQGMRRIPRDRLTLDQARSIVARRFASREAAFLALLSNDVFGHSASPYLPLLRRAGCELGDVEALVRGEGLHATLQTLRRAEVYVSFEEFKGRAPIKRGNLTYAVSPDAFDRPRASRGYRSRSGGSSGPSTRTTLDLGFFRAGQCSRILLHAAYGLERAPTAAWRNELPDTSGICILYVHAILGNPIRRWFTPIVPSGLENRAHYRVATRLCVLAGRSVGVPLAWPEPLALDDADVVARWAVAAVQRRGACMLRAHASMALRICLAAQEHGLSLAGVTFVSGGEPVTASKARQITATGARLIPQYVSSELMTVGMGCAAPAAVDDMHLCDDTFALIQHPREVPGADVSVPAFCFTGLIPENPLVLLNLESDDYGTLEERACGCPLEAYGYRRHIRDVGSFSRLTGEGVTLIGSDMLRILEDVLPARFGGSALDYQLAEEEDEQGYTRLVLRVHPRLDLPAETEVVQTVLEALERSGGAASMAQAIWAAAGTLRIRRAAPVWTAHGKLMPLHLARRPPPSGGASPISADPSPGR